MLNIYETSHACKHLQRHVQLSLYWELGNGHVQPSQVATLSYVRNRFKFYILMIIELLDRLKWFEILDIDFDFTDRF